MLGLPRLKKRREQGEALRAKEEEIAGLNSLLSEKDREIGMLRKEAAALERKLEEAADLRAQAIQGLIDDAVAAATAPLIAELAEARLEIGRLNAIIKKDSSNSSKPPSSDGFKNVPNSREKSDRHKGGQIGHPGSRLALPENIDELEASGIVERRVVDHTGGASEYITRYVIDVKVVTIITEHRFAKDAQLPEELYNEVSYGDMTKALSLLLLNEGIIAEKRMSEIIEGITQGVVSISPATLESFQSQLALKIECGGELEAIKEDLLAGDVMHTDDTPMRCSETVEYLDDGSQAIHAAQKGSFRATVRTHSNGDSTLFTVNPKKDMAGVERDGVLTDYDAILSHDHEAKFYNCGGVLHSTCGEHLLRELKGLRDLKGIPWAGLMRAHMTEMNTHKNKDLEQGKTACDPNLLQGFEKKYYDLLEQGRGELAMMAGNEIGYSSFRAMLNRLAEYDDCYLLFMRNYKAPFTNNMAERDLRPLKTKEKISYLFRSWKGLKNYVVIRSYISTMKKRRIDLYSAISSINRGKPVLSR